MFDFMIKFFTILKEFFNEIVSFFHSNASLSAKLFISAIILMLTIWLIPILDFITDIIITLIIYFFKYTKKFFKFIFRIKTKTLFLKQGDITYYFEANIDGKLKIIKIETKPRKFHQDENTKREPIVFKNDEEN